ncbi:peptide-methionine (S)-S-oxide reductase [Brevundimonas sp. GW460-12-10-14-LB2]|jgi:peptide-methionine (S)-S-oxide reductase|uniref:peptide-methionine (S)-S-oxide reductase MsrA n=1 Tax=Brevundimonas sp. GW460-12-10-14-LB2 TaxID=1827469 RepID=UPI0007BC9FFF|nr:peptide-methionine (S)-S-oxide reductase MsrA [Brevundimonas sp. GW460-12-10-14-LB2]ANC53301.1 peptide-methionine (S)-S-oxide reductase [Brevundimonas sp. GW460-12-10-14-LB2]MEA3474455.1 peptide-methionine (S)-S-oxide reductase MsrA [Pseudomonadota bacterium]
MFLRTTALAAVASLTVAALAIGAPLARRAEAQTALQTAIFAGGCFWSEEKAFDDVPGVRSAVSGFVGGHTANPSYEQVVRGGTGHMEAVQVTFDPRVVSYRTLVDRYWRTIDPTDPNGQFCDQGPSYRSAVFATAAQRADAVASRDAAMRVLRKSFTTPVVGAQRFWPAGEEHQNYAKRHAASYQAYRIGCRRPERLRAIWGDAAVS